MKYCLRITFLLLFYLFITAESQTKPDWCPKGYAKQSDAAYALCSTNFNQHEQSTTRSSWCNGKNFYSSMSISMRDRDLFNECDHKDAHCVEEPKEEEFHQMDCFESVDPNEIQFDKTTNYTKKCKNVNAILPVEVKDSKGVLRQLLVLSALKGILVVDMLSETILQKHLSNDTNLDFFKVVPGSYDKFFFVGGAKGKDVFVWEFRFDLNNNDFTITMKPKKTVSGTVLDLTTFWDHPSQKSFVAVVLGDDNNKPSTVEFLEIRTNQLAKTVTWTMTLATGTTFVKIDSTKHLQPDRTASPTSIGCFPATQNGQKTLIQLYTQKYIYFWGFMANTPTGAIDLTKTESVGNNLFYEAPVGSTITASYAYGECFGDFAATSEQLWIAVALNKQTENTFRLIPLPEFAQVDFSCINDGSKWWKRPTSPIKIDGTCQHHDTICDTPEKYAKIENGGTTCSARVEVTTKLTLSEKVQEFAYAFSSDNKVTTTEDEISHTYMHLLYAVGNNAIDVIGFQEKMCEQNEQPTINLMNTIRTKNHIKHASISRNAQHLFTAHEMRDWEVEAHNQKVQICADILKNPNEQYNAQFKTECQQHFPARVSLYSFIQYHSECNGGWNCPRYGSLNQRNHQSRIELEIPAGKHFMRPTSTYNCEPGFYCPNFVHGIRQRCPIGFKCPTASMVAPLQCTTGPNFENSCLEEQQTTEVGKCPEGEICRSSHRSILTPPGYYVRTTNRKFILQCWYGHLCPLGVSNNSINTVATDVLQNVNLDVQATTITTTTTTGTLCPAGYYCPSPELLEPIKCVTAFDEKLNRINNFTEYCPAGTFGAPPHHCPAEFECKDTSTAKACEDGYFCPAGTQYASPCAAGTYCPTPQTFLSCPLGYYCREATQNPTQCQWLVYCPEGSTTEQYAFIALLVDLVVIIGALIIFQCVRICFTQVKRKRRKKKMKINVKKGEAITQVDDDEEDEEAIAMGENDEFDNNDEVLPKKNFTVDIEFENVNVLRLKNKKYIMKDLNIKMYHGRVCGILGTRDEDPNVIMDILAGTGYYVDTQGAIKINGQPEKNMKQFYNIIGKVPKSSDALQDLLRVSEVIRFTAHSRLPQLTTYSEITIKMSTLMQVLGIEWLKNKHIGKKTSSVGLNTYQRRMVNLAQEIIAEPSILLMYEPISNVAPHEANKIMKNLKTIAKSGVCVVCSIDDPRYEFYKQLDDVILLGNSGEVVYAGPTNASIKYFAEIGFKVPDFVNPSNYFNSVIHGNVKRDGEDTSFDATKLGDIWEVKQQEQGKPWYIPVKKESEETTESLFLKKEETQEEKLIRKVTEDEKNRSRAGIFSQFFIYWIRTTVELIRDYQGQAMDIVFYALAATMIGGIFFNLDFIGPITPALQQLCPDFIRQRVCAMPRVDKLGPIFGLTSLTLAISAFYSALKVFGRDSEVYKREVETGVIKISYFAAKVAAYAPACVLLPAIYILVWYSFIVPRNNFFYYYGIFLLIQMVWSSFGILCSVVLKKEHASFLGLLVVLFSGLLSGLSPTVKTLMQTWYTTPQIALSPLRYSFEALYLTEISVYRNDGVRTDSALEQYGYSSLNEIILCVIMHFVFTFVFLLATYLILVFKDPKIREFFKILRRRIWMFIKRPFTKKSNSKEEKLARGYAALMAEEELEELEFQQEKFEMEVEEFEEIDEDLVLDLEDDEEPLILDSNIEE